MKVTGVKQFKEGLKGKNTLGTELTISEWLANALPVTIGFQHKRTISRDKHQVINYVPVNSDFLVT